MMPFFKGGAHNGNRLKTLFQRPNNGNQKLQPATRAQQRVNTELANRLERLRSEGFVDLKVTCGRSSSTQDKLWVLNNVLRRSEAGLCETTVLTSTSRSKSDV